jgi:hypothetical protein
MDQDWHHGTVAYPSVMVNYTDICLLPRAAHSAHMRKQPDKQALAQTIRLKVARRVAKNAAGCRQIHGLYEAVASDAAILGSLRG